MLARGGGCCAAEGEECGEEGRWECRAKGLVELREERSALHLGGL